MMKHITLSVHKSSIQSPIRWALSATAFVLMLTPSSYAAYNTIGSGEYAVTWDFDTLATTNGGATYTTTSLSNSNYAGIKKDVTMTVEAINNFNWETGASDGNKVSVSSQSGLEFRYAARSANYNMKISFDEDVWLLGTTAGRGEMSVDPGSSYVGKTVTLATSDGAGGFNEVTSHNSWSYQYKAEFTNSWIHIEAGDYIYLRHDYDVDDLGAAPTWNYMYAVVPEPTTYALIFGTLALGLAFIKRRQRNNTD